MADVEEKELETPNPAAEAVRQNIVKRQIGESKKQRTCEADEEIVSMQKSEKLQKAGSHTVVAIFPDPDGATVHKVKQVKQEKKKSEK